ncbi:DNA repair protein RecO [Pedobacter changchengzhani]|uniref:DNA repair protein RecO n=1 Tax=Pedobacter changchengzhani TaxID=2529274 RepID=A0A4R5MIM5_9SPHI|nr:DNA repair protein RecO [Pedobacter changchengzhani]TDG35390.1 DNA repair protein RecO [Pedobacter changchengzhani]
MLHKVRGIVLKTTNYSETSVVVQVFTDKFGMQSYLINGVKKPRAKIKMNMLQSLHLLDMVVYHNVNANIQRVSEIRQTPVFKTIPYDIIKSSVTIFLNEVLYKSIRQQAADESLFDYIFNTIAWFDETEQLHPNFHLSFLLKLTRFLGFYPNDKRRQDQNYFDLHEGEFVSRQPFHLNFLELDDALRFISLFNTPLEKIIEIKFSNEQRRFLLDKILVFYTLHTASFGEIQSHKILETLLS